MKRFFVGPKQTTIEYSDFFDGSITLFGNNTSTNTSFQNHLAFDFWNPDNNPLEIDIYNREIAKLSQPTEIMAHNPLLLSRCTLPDNVYQICKNDQSILENLDDKIKTRKLMKNVVPMIDYYTIKGEDFDYQQLSSISDTLVVQHPIGGGGSKTLFCNQKNNQQIKSMLEPQSYYSISAFKQVSASYNIHCLVSHNQIEILPPSAQKLEISDIIEYFGNDFEINIPVDSKNKLVQYSNEVCRKIQGMGYRGILGIDYIETKDELYFIEINPRFQGSTPQVDALLKESRLPSIFDYNYRAFNGKEMPSTANMQYSILNL